MNIFFDLDGTLINSSNRLFLLFQYLVPKSTFTFEEYWELKKNQINHKEILKNHFNYDDFEYATFEKQWMDQIEMKKWLDLDQPFENVTDFIKDLSKEHQIYLVTARQLKSEVINQIEKFGWSNIFTQIFITEQRQSKFELISANVKRTSFDWFVGDTGKDIETGKMLGVKTAAVLSGFLNNKSLIKYHPDLIVDRVTNINF